MKRISVVLISLMSCLFLSTSAFAFGGPEATSSSYSGAVASGSYVNNTSQGLTNNPAQNVNITQYGSVIPESQGRFFLQLPNIPSAPLINYFGPWKEPANILETTLGLPTKVTMVQAKKAYNGGVDSDINLLNPVTYQTDTCELVTAIPMGAVTRGYTFLKGKGGANTITVLMKAYQDAMTSGATKIVILKKQASTKNEASGWTIGIGGGVSTIQGDGGKTGVAVGGGTGYSSGSSEPVYKDGMAVMMLE